MVQAPALRDRLWSGSPGLTPASPLDLPVLTTTTCFGGHGSGLAMTVGDQLVQDVGMVEHGTAPRMGGEGTTNPRGVRRGEAESGRWGRSSGDARETAT